MERKVFKITWNNFIYCISEIFSVVQFLRDIRTPFLSVLAGKGYELGSIPQSSVDLYFPWKLEWDIEGRYRKVATGIWNNEGEVVRCNILFSFRFLVHIVINSGSEFFFPVNEVK